jgi:hypothetical protein
MIVLFLLSLWSKHGYKERTIAIELPTEFSIEKKIQTYDDSGRVDKYKDRTKIGTTQIIKGQVVFLT